MLNKQVLLIAGIINLAVALWYMIGTGHELTVPATTGLTLLFIGLAVK